MPKGEDGRCRGSIVRRPCQEGQAEEHEWVQGVEEHGRSEPLKQMFSLC